MVTLDAREKKHTREIGMLLLKNRKLTVESHQTCVWDVAWVDDIANQNGCYKKVWVGVLDGFLK